MRIIVYSFICLTDLGLKSRVGIRRYSKSGFLEIFKDKEKPNCNSIIFLNNQLF